MQVSKIEVKGLFGLFNHSIALQEQSRLTIIHGPNGFGKTVVLSMIHGFIAGQMEVFHRVPFEEFRIHFDLGVSVAIRPTVEAPDRSKAKRARRFAKARLELEYEIKKDGEEGQVLPRPLRSSEPSGPPLEYLLTKLDQEAVPSPFTLHGTQWLNASTGTRHSLQDLMEIVPRLREHPLTTRALRQLSSGEPDEVVLLRKELSSYFIRTQRLNGPLERKNPAYDFDPATDLEGRLSVEKYAGELASMIQNALADYGKHSQQLDRSFPARLVQFLRDDAKALGDQNILDRLRELDSRRENLMRIGFLEKESSLSDLTQADVTRASQALTIYVDDVAQKLSVFDDIEKRVTLFMDIINERFLYKRMSASRLDGFNITSLVPKAADQVARISLRDLSSGEQHELVVVFELLFKVPKRAFILIDEPEISLHVAWQSNFLQDLVKILDVNDGQALVATHSPVIIGERWDLTQRLDGPSSGRSDA
jgi:predicted ATP-binding protein involved in virulence